MQSISEPLLLATLLANLDEGVVVLSAGGSVVSWNPASEKIFGLSQDDALGVSVAELLPDGPRLLLAAQAGESVRVRTEGRAGDGRRIEVSVTLSSLGAPSSESLGALLLLRSAGGPDFETSRDADRLSLVLAASGLGDWHWDAKTDVVTFSPRAAEIFDVPLGVPKTRTAMRELFHPVDWEAARIVREKALAERGHYAVEYRLINGGRERWVSVSGRGRYDDHGQLLSMLGVVQDLTSDRLLLRVDDAVRALTEPEEITYTAARVLGEYMRVNRCAYAFVEDDQDTFILTGNYNNGAESIVGRYRFRQFGAECLRLMRAGLPYVVEDSTTDPRLDEEDRKAYELTTIRAVICVPILKSARFVGAMAVHMRSVRRWRSVEVELVQQVASRCWESIERARIERERQKLLETAETANRAKDEFLAMLGHELRNPLAPIVTAMQLMRLRGDRSTERERTLVERQVDHLTRLVDDLLDVSRIARGKVELKPEVVEIAEVVSRAIEVASPLLEQQSHTLVRDVQRHGLPVHGDVARLTQVVSNLLSNAAKYTPRGGRITVSAADEGDEIVLRVQDNGIGMTPATLAHAFDLFVQGQQSIDRTRGGLGLGLTIVKSLVERHGGTVSASSEGSDRGSIFVVRLPRSLEATATVPAPASEQLPKGSSPGVRILLVDDNADATDMLAAVLAYYGCEVEVAHDGLEALRLVDGRTFDAALLDIGLPMMDGYELAAHLRELPNLAETRLIAVTGYGQESDRRRSLAAGFEEHLVKPVDPLALERIVTRLRIDRHSPSCRQELP